MKFKWALYAGVILLTHCGSITSAISGSFGINPVKITFKKNQTIETMTIRNDQDVSLVVHLKIMAWDQKNGEDQYVNTKDIVAVPNVVTIKPKSVQIVRIANRTKPDPVHEKAYRVFINELPVKNATDTGQKGGLNFVLCVGVPIFVQAQRPADEKVNATLHWDGDELKLKNHGFKHIHMHKIQHHPYQKKASQIFQYVLPKQAVPVKLPSAALTDDAMVITHIDDEVLKLDVPSKPQ